MVAQVGDLTIVANTKHNLAESNEKKIGKEAQKHGLEIKQNKTESRKEKYLRKAPEKADMRI